MKKFFLILMILFCPCIVWAGSSNWDSLIWDQDVWYAGSEPPTACTATIDGNLLFHIPYLSHIDPMLGTISLWADLLYEFNPKYSTLMLFKYLNSGINNPPYSCVGSTLSTDLKIHIPDVLVPDGSTHLWVDLEHSSTLSTDGNAYFVVTKYGVNSN